MSDALELGTPDDLHVHLRDGRALADTVRDVARVFGRALAMPNLAPPVASAEALAAYRARILAARPAGAAFEPLMALYLTDRVTPAVVRAARAAGAVAAKLYPAGATTNSDAGVTDLGALDATLAAMADERLLLLVHGEVTGADVDVFDREARFLDEVLAPLIARHPRLKVVLEHITTARAASFVAAGPETLAATITAHHLLLNRNDLLAGRVRPHLYCLPILKRESDRQALVAAATGGSPRFFLGTDSAPHARDAKECAAGCAGTYTAHRALELYAEAFDAAGVLDRLDGFASRFGADFYGLPRNPGRVRLTREEVAVPATLAFGDDVVVPLRAGERVRFSAERVAAGA
ncbi:MAG: dihydroorotase [Deltaproteobacteria bacterium]|nr:dihydroorotase [Deltaproteobacteria bacterium]